MSENDPRDTGAMALTGEDLVEGAAATAWARSGPINGEGNAIRQLFASGDLDGGTLIVEACMNGPYADPNFPASAPAADEIVSLAADVSLDDLATRAQQVFATRAHWIRAAVSGAGGDLDLKVWLK